MNRYIRASILAATPVLAAVLLASLPAGDALARDKEIVGNFIVYRPVGSADTTGSIGIELQGLWGSPNDIPDLFSFSQTDLIATRIQIRQLKHLSPEAFVLDGVEDWFAKDPAGLRWINPFASPDGKTGLFAFRVKVRNPTPQALRMGDWRVYLKVAGQDEAIAPSSDFAFYSQWMLGKDVAMNNHKEGPLAAIQPGYVIRHVPYPIGVAGVVLALRFPPWDVADLMRKEVPAGASATGFLFFPAEMGADTVSVSFSPPQVIPGSTGAGPPEHEFKFRKDIEAYWWEKNQKRWVSGGGKEE